MHQYALLKDNTRDADMLGRLAEAEPKLQALLQVVNRQALLSARLLFREMSDDVYPKRLVEALTAGEAFIRMDPRIAYEGSPLEFCVRFNQEFLNSIAAREEWTCLWNFGDGLMESSGLFHITF